MYLIQANLEVLQLALLDNEVVFVIQILHYVVMSLFVVLQDHGFDRRIAFNQQTCRGYKVLARYLRKQEKKRS